MRLHLAPLALLASFSAVGGIASGQLTLLDQQPSQTFSLLSHIGVEATADNFVVSNPVGETVGGFTIWGTWTTSGMQNSDTFDVFIHDNDTTIPTGDVPGNVLGSFTAQSPVVTATGGTMPTAGGQLPEYELVFTLPSAVPLTAGTFWIELYSTGSSGSSDRFVWEMAPQDPILGAACVSWSFQTPGVTWQPCTPFPETDMALQVRGLLGAPYCFGDGSGTICSCGNPGGPGEGCANSTGVGATITAHGSTSVSADDLYFDAFGMLPNQSMIFFYGTNALGGGNGVVFGDGLRCAGGTTQRGPIVSTDGGGGATWGPGLAATYGWGPGETRFFQAWYRDPGGPCGTNFNLSHGLEITTDA